jgi:hypothetical protein
MTPKKFKKQPWEKRVLNVDCTDALPTGVTITTLDPEMYDDEGTDVTATMIDTFSIDTHHALITVMAGTDGETYDLKIKLTLSNGEQVEDDMKVIVKEKGQ